MYVYLRGGGEGSRGLLPLCGCGVTSLAIVNLWWLGLTLSSPCEPVLSRLSPILGRDGGEGDGGREEGERREGRRGSRGEKRGGWRVQIKRRKKEGEGRRRRGKRRRMEGEGGEEGEAYNENLHDKRLR